MMLDVDSITMLPPEDGTTLGMTNISCNSGIK
jgi:hypothetical protein